jgi:hypothetical protein
VPIERRAQPLVNSDLLSDAALIRASSPKIFERGKTYASSGAISIVGEQAVGGCVEARDSGWATRF